MKKFLPIIALVGLAVVGFVIWKKKSPVAAGNSSSGGIFGIGASDTPTQFNPVNPNSASVQSDVFGSLLKVTANLVGAKDTSTPILTNTNAAGKNTPLTGSQTAWNNLLKVIHPGTTNV